MGRLSEFSRKNRNLIFRTELVLPELRRRELPPLPASALKRTGEFSGWDTRAFKMTKLLEKIERKTAS
jgi:hypothetical protein